MAGVKKLAKAIFFACGRWVYVKTLPYPRVRKVLSQVNGKLRIVADPRKIFALHGAVTKRFCWNEGRLPKEFVVAMIAEEPIFEGFKFECNAVFVESARWKESFERNSVDLFFLGVKDSGKIQERQILGKTDCLLTNNCRIRYKTIVSILKYCKRHGIPTVFWSESDPRQFKNIAFRFDYICTADFSCTKSYNDKESKLHLLMNATQPHLFNPIEEYDRADEIVFIEDESRQNLTLSERAKELFDSAGHDKFERESVVQNGGDGSSDITDFFSKKCKICTCSFVQQQERQQIYKKYKYVLNIHSDDLTDTAIPQCVFEMMSSNALVVTSYSREIEATFGNNVVFLDDKTSLTPELLSEKRNFCLQKVLKEHTFERRFLQILDMVGLPYKNPSPTVGIVCKIHDLDSAEKAVSMLHTQEYWFLKLVLLVEASCPNYVLNTVVKEYQSSKITVISLRYIQEYNIAVNTECDFFICLNAGTPSDFIARAVCHVCYLDEATAIAQGGKQQYIFTEKTFMKNTLYPIQFFEDFCVEKDMPIKTYWI